MYLWAYLYHTSEPSRNRYDDRYERVDFGGQSPGISIVKVAFLQRFTDRFLL